MVSSIINFEILVVFLTLVLALVKTAAMFTKQKEWKLHFQILIILRTFCYLITKYKNRHYLLNWPLQPFTQNYSLSSLVAQVELEIQLMAVDLINRKKKITSFTKAIGEKWIAIISTTGLCCPQKTKTYRSWILMSLRFEVLMAQKWFQLRWNKFVASFTFQLIMWHDVIYP